MTSAAGRSFPQACLPRWFCHYTDYKMAELGRLFRRLLLGIPTGQRFVKVPLDGITADSFALATLQQCRANLWVQSITVSASSAAIYIYVSRGRGRRSFTDVKCDGFSAGSIMTQDRSAHPISGGQLRVDSGSLGNLTGEFTSPTAIAGSIELTINPGIGSRIPCGTWDWSASRE
jgi:hypothetical protein